MLLNKSDILGNIIYNNPSIIPILNRFGIKLGVGDLCIQKIAQDNNLDIDFLLTVLNTYLNENYFPQFELNNIDCKQIANYIETTNGYYLKVQLPNIEKHLNAFIGMSMSMGVDKSKLMALGHFLRQLRTSLEAQINEVHTSNPQDIIRQMLLLMVNELSGDYNQNLCYATVFALKSLENDMQRHVRIKERILLPIIEAQKNGVQPVSPIKNIKEQANGKVLSPREIDVLKLIIAGKLNKEIASILNISFQTVLSHRKNITSKLGIKTVSGLTFYAIINGYVKINEQDS